MHNKYILTHPIQYQAPLIKYLTKKGIKITVLYRSNFSTIKLPLLSKLLNKVN